ncbi:hypothetical protein AB4Y44_13180 [Paraburkholderia sp. BR10937]|uniref:hypothetical protein n=1 Tax=Paraburkholderia sp. BR10937 TaxID=3236994 RepID=UPI0034D31B30
MFTTFSRLSRTVLVVALCTASTAAFARHARQPQVPPESISSLLLSDDERIEFCTEMHRASTLEERRVVVERMRNTLIPRAKAQDLSLPRWLLEGRPMNGFGGPNGSIPGLDCESGISRLHAQAVAPARQAPAHKTPPTETPPGKTPVQEMPASDIPVGHDRGIAYVTGGVGEDEATALRRLAPGYSMRATFTAASGEYLSGVAVQIFGSNGKVVFAGTSAGPYLFARLPPGHYRVVATFDGVERTRVLYIPTRGSVRFTLTWSTSRAASSS